MFRGRFCCICFIVLPAESSFFVSSDHFAHITLGLHRKLSNVLRTRQGDAGAVLLCRLFRIAGFLPCGMGRTQVPLFHRAILKIKWRESFGSMSLRSEWCGSPAAALAWSYRHWGLFPPITHLIRSREGSSSIPDCSPSLPSSSSSFLLSRRGLRLEEGILWRKHGGVSRTLESVTPAFKSWLTYLSAL